MTLLLAVLTTTTAWADSWPEYITDIILVGGTESEVNAAKSAHSDYTFISQDLNAGCGSGSDYIYLGYKKGSRANVNGGYITDIIVIDAEGTNPPSTVTYSGRTYYLCPYDGGSHFEDVKGNLNSNCGGGWNLYLYYTKANIGKQAVSSITVNSTKDGAINCYYTNGNSHETQIDLNRGLSGSSDVYMHLSTATKTNRPSTDPVMASGLTYNDGEQQLIATAATLASGTMYYRIGTSGSWTSTVADVKATAAGSYTVYYYAGSNSYSDASSTHSTTVTIGKSANSGVTVSCADIVEGNALNPQLGGTNLSTGAVTYKYCTTQNGTYTATAPTAAGTYYVKATVAGDGNCNEFTTAYASFKIVGDWALHNGGDSEADAYVISTTDDLDLLAQRVNDGTAYKNKFFKLGDDITYSHTTDWNDATSTENNFTPIGTDVYHTFKGTFDGNGKTVSGIRIKSANGYKGLFGFIYDGAVVKNVILSDARIIGYAYNGGIAGKCNYSTITNCWVKSNVCVGNRNEIGGIAGRVLASTISGCRSEATLTAYSSNKYYGGIAGCAESSAVSHCVVVGATIPNADDRGAIVGGNYESTFTSNYYTACTVAGVANAANVGCQGADANGARQAVAIGAATGVTVTPTGTATTYDVSGITAYDGNSGILYGGTLYAGATETVTLTVAYTVPDGCTLNGFTDGNGNALADNGDGTYTLTMTGAAATVTPDVYDPWGIASGRDGSTAGNAYLITTPADLDLLATRVNGGTNYYGKYFEMGADITYSYDGLGENESNYTAIGTGSGNYFKGKFDGKGHTVSGIRIYMDGTNNQGIFGKITEYAEVKNVTIADARITGHYYVGGIVGWNSYGTVENCYALSTVTVSGTSNIGGITGYNEGTVKGCTSAATVSGSNGSYYVGGIVGGNSGGTTQDCLVLGGSVSGSNSVGAIAGSNDGGGTLTNNYHTIHGMGGVNGSDQDGAEIVVRIAAADGVTLSLPAATYVWNEQNLYKSGTVVTLNCTVPDGKVFDHYTVNSGDISNADSQTGEHTLTGFSQDVTITGIFADLVNVTYIAADGTAQSHAAAEIDGSKTNLPGGWYVVNSDVALTTKLNFTGDTHLILADGKTLSIDASGDSDPNYFFLGLSCRDGSTSYELTIYGQAAGTGKVTAKHGHPGYGSACGYNAKTITINGGVVEATSSGRGICGSNVIINGGQIILAPSYANITADNITLGWRKPSDYIQAHEFVNPSGVGTITITDGKLFTDGTGIYDHTTTTGTLEKLTNKTLHPCLVLTDNASNADAIAEYDGETIAVALNGRTLYKDGAWNTLCLPFDVDITNSPLAGDPGNNPEAKTLKSGTSGLSGSTLTLNFDDATTIPAGTPFLMKWSNTAETITNPVFIGVTIDKNASTEISFSGGKFVGSYSPVDFTADDRSILFLGAANQLHWPNADMTLGACRAHFELSDGNKVSEILLNFDGEETTSLREKGIVNSEKFAAAAEWYTLDGRRLSQKPTQKGLYIHNGRKEVLK